jgi:CubicO group peptidase (beta-lactamase class C family)
MPELTQQGLEHWVAEVLNRWPAVGLAVGVVSRGSPPLIHIHGVANIPDRTPVTEGTVFRIGSITKTFTAVAIMQLWEQGLVDLDRPANDYLRAYELVPLKSTWRPATVRHLLTHTAGVPEWVRPTQMVRSRWFGETFPLEERLPTLGEFYRGRLRLDAEPGTVWAYTDHGIATVGQIIEDITGVPLHRYLAEHVFAPLNMTDSDLLRAERLQGRLATGYTLTHSGPKALTDRNGLTAAAGAIYSTPRDMARYVAALVGGGNSEHGTILKPETFAAMFAPHYQPDPRIPGMGLAFWRGELGGHAVVEHQGVVPGFNSQIYLAPEDGIGVMAFTNGSRNAGTWLVGEMRDLLGDLIDAGEDSIRTDIPQRPDVWADLCGWYRPRAQRTDMMARLITGAGVQVSVRRGRLVLRALAPMPPLYHGLTLHPADPDDPDAFQVDLARYGLGTGRIVFSRDRSAHVTGVHFDGLLLSADKKADSASQGLRVAAAVGTTTAATTAGTVRHPGRTHPRQR